MATARCDLKPRPGPRPRVETAQGELRPQQAGPVVRAAQNRHAAGQRVAWGSGGVGPAQSTCPRCCGHVEGEPQRCT